jgi:hypothetical protein
MEFTGLEVDGVVDGVRPYNFQSPGTAMSIVRPDPGKMDPGKMTPERPLARRSDVSG